MLNNYFGSRNYGIYQVIVMLFLAFPANAQIYYHNFNTAATTHPYTVAPVTIDSHLSGSSWANSVGAWSNNQGSNSSGNSITVLPPTGTTPSTVTTESLTFTVANGFQVEVTAFDFWRQRSSTGPTNWTISINGTPMGSGTTPTIGAPTGITNVSTPISGLTGTVTVTLSLTGATGGNQRLDDFYLYGSVTPNCTSAVISSLSPVTGPANTIVTIAGTGFTNASSVKFNGTEASAFTVISDTSVKATVPGGATSGIVTVTVNGCDGYSTPFTVLTSQCNTPGEIYISELYDQESGSGGMIELYNPTSTAISLSGYVLQRYGNIADAAPTNGYILALTGSIPAGGTYLISGTTPNNSICASPNASQNIGNGFNGNDKFELLKNGALIDVVHVPYTAPGFTLIRKPNAVAPKTTYNITDWNNTQHPADQPGVNLPNNFCQNLGMHTVAPTPIPVITHPASISICENATGTFTTSVTPSAGFTFQWKVLNSVGTWVNVVNGPNYNGATTATLSVLQTPLSFNGNQYYCQITSSTCTLYSNAAQLTVTTAPPIADVSVIQPTCTTPTGTITILTPTGTGLSYSVNGVDFFNTLTFATLSPGNYTISVKNSTGCVSVTGLIIINAVPGAPAVADVSVMQPTCTTLTGSITVTAPTGFTYSINGIDFSTATTFPNLNAGTYYITVKNASGCTSVTPDIIINSAPALPAQPTLTVAQPTCTTTTGSITVTTPLGTGLTYSSNGVDFQPEILFDNLTPGNYTITVKNAAGCTATSLPVTINPAPVAPAMATNAVTQPTCTNPTGTITVNSPLGSGITYSNNGIDFQSQPVFSGLAPGAYVITVKNAAGCTSVTPNVIVNPAPAQPTQPIVTIVQPTCGTPTGTIAVTSPTGVTYTYSSNDIDFQTQASFSNLLPGTYTITVKNSDGCTAAINNVIINNIPAAPATANTTITQPTCTNATSSITVNSPLGTNFTYSLDGINFQAETTFINLIPGTYAVTVKNTDGCTSVSNTIIITTQPSPPAVANTTVTQPTCKVTTGTITVNSPIGNEFSYSLDGVNFQNSLVFANLQPGTYTITVQQAPGCTSVTNNIIIDPVPSGLPAITQPAPLSVCDENTDTFGTFNLLPTMQAIEASLTNVVVTAYETQSDADLGVIPIPNPGSYPTINPNTQTLYLRVQSTLTECYDTVTLVLIVNPRPAAVSPAAAYALCDDGVSDNDGQAVFNLNTQSAEILNGLDPAQYSIAYYTDATATALIGTPGNFVSGTATVYAKVTNNATGCFYIVPVRLVVNGLPVLITNQYSYSLCDTSGDPDREEFDLTSVIGQFITDGNRNGVSVQFYTSLAAAQAGGTGPELITGETAYTNVPPQVQSLYVRFEVMATGCYRLGYLDIRVEPQPVIEEPSAEELTVCDTNGTGIGTFDLEALKAGMANGGANLDITFHLTYEDAVSGANPIPNTTNYKNGNPYTEILYVRVVNTVSGCYNTRPYAITLHVNPAPQAPDLADITLCDDIDNNGQDGAAKTDITLYEDDIDAAVDPVDVDITYYTSEADANTPVRAIANPATYTAHDNQVIWVRVEDAAGCYSVTSFTIHFNKPHALVNPTPFALCNELLPNDGITSFDLTQKDDEILGAAGVGRGYTVEYFTTNPKGNTGAVAIPDPKAFTNTTNPQVIYVRVTTKAGCVSYTSLSIKVLPLPEPNFNPAPLVLCDDDQATAGSEPFDLTDAGDDILANGDYELSYYETEEDANNKVNPIPDPTSYTSTGGVVYVRVEANTNNPAEPGCYQVVALTLRVDPLPPVADLDDLAHCEQGTDGQDTFNLLEAVNTALGGNTAGEYEVEVYEDPALTTPAIPITAYEVTGGTATVYVVVESTATGCRIVKELQLYVEEAATANPVADPSPVCDTEGDNDGVVTWDLTQFDSDALGTQAPGVYQVTYHTTEQDAIDGINAIATPQAYENTPQEQVLWVRVTNTATITKCSDVTSFTLRVEIRPEPVITGEGGSNTICIDFGATEGELVLNSGVVPAGHTYQWFKGGVLLSDSDQSGEYIARTEGVYTVIVTGPAPLNCVSDTSAAFTVIKSGQASQVGKGYYVTNYFSDNQTITVAVEGNGEYTYQLDNGPRQPDPVFTNVSPGYHKVTVYDEKTDFPCQELTIDGVSIVDYPNFFTPNGDGFHDTWNIIGLSGTGSVIYIFDRYGKLIKQISPDLNSDGWDGTMNGVPVPATDYWFSVTYPEFDGTTTVTKEFKSHFSLKR